MDPQLHPPQHRHRTGPDLGYSSHQMSGGTAVSSAEALKQRESQLAANQHAPLPAHALGSFGLGPDGVSSPSDLVFVDDFDNFQATAGPSDLSLNLNDFDSLQSGAHSYSNGMPATGIAAELGIDSYEDELPKPLTSADQSYRGKLHHSRSGSELDSSTSRSDSTATSSNDDPFVVDLQMVKTTMAAVNAELGVDLGDVEVDEKALVVPSTDDSGSDESPDDGVGKRRDTGSSTGKGEMSHVRLICDACGHIVTAVGTAVLKAIRESKDEAERLGTTAKSVPSLRKKRGGILGFKELASRAKLSPWHFHRVFRSVTGVTPKAYGEALWDYLMRKHGFASEDQLQSHSLGQISQDASNDSPEHIVSSGAPLARIASTGGAAGANNQPGRKGIRKARSRSRSGRSRSRNRSQTQAQVLTSLATQGPMPMPSSGVLSPVVGPTGSYPGIDSALQSDMRQNPHQRHLRSPHRQPMNGHSRSNSQLNSATSPLVGSVDNWLANEDFIKSEPLSSPHYAMDIPDVSALSLQKPYGNMYSGLAPMMPVKSESQGSSPTMQRAQAQLQQQEFQQQEFQQHLHHQAQQQAQQAQHAQQAQAQHHHAQQAQIQRQQQLRIQQQQQHQLQQHQHQQLRQAQHLQHLQDQSLSQSLDPTASWQIVVPASTDDPLLPQADPTLAGAMASPEFERTMLRDFKSSGGSSTPTSAGLGESADDLGSLPQTFYMDEKEKLEFEDSVFVGDAEADSFLSLLNVEGPLSKASYASF